MGWYSAFFGNVAQHPPSLREAGVLGAVQSFLAFSSKAGEEKCPGGRWGNGPGDSSC